MHELGVLGVHTTTYVPVVHTTTYELEISITSIETLFAHLDPVTLMPGLAFISLSHAAIQARNTKEVN